MEFARVIDWNPKWDTGAPTPQVFSNGHKTFLIYLVGEPNSNFNGTDVTEIETITDTEYLLALVEFSGDTFRFGIANDEVFSELPLWKRGLQFYCAHIIENSAWIKEIKGINKEHPYFDQRMWSEKKHFVLLFHDEIFEVIAKDYKIEVHKFTFEQLGQEVVRRMNCE